MDSPTEANLRRENSQLRSNYNILERRLDNSLRVMENIQKRDDNFYRVMLQLDPVARDSRISGLDNEQRYQNLSKLSDAAMLTRVAREMDILERQILAQSQSFDELRKTAEDQTIKFRHIPSVLPLPFNSSMVAAGFGMRRDPVNATSRFHSGMDFSASEGTPVYAAADGRVEAASRRGGYGNCIDISHGYNYLSRYANLRDIQVKVGQNVKRGDRIGTVGNTGKSSAPHLHYEVRFKGEAQNPVDYYFMELTPDGYADMIQLSENAADLMD
ncbi:MAG: M23 family metallopeptidase [Clostridium sp.]|nr:M23 family metallopeptidase [Prevotella sp.]MCM1428829.1 M23 family metallopeptidase [Clostridium sp.]MCM1475204.1 M23 family metallopeptidase [Muribaculaceae bacterium]